jgi:hypothetical protein
VADGVCDGAGKGVSRKDRRRTCLAGLRII